MLNLITADFDTFLQIIKRFPHELLPVWRESHNSYPLEILSALCPEGALSSCRTTRIWTPRYGRRF